MTVQGILRRYRAGGTREVWRAIVQKFRRIEADEKYQEKLQSSFEDRWKLVRSALPSDGGSLLDIGSNLGAFTARAAQEGFISIGIEKDRRLVQRAIATHSEVSGCAFMEADIGLDLCAKLPSFDAVLLLSVHHHWHHIFGPEAAAEMLRCMVTKARQVVVFEGPSRSSRYESNVPNFPDNCEDALLAYHDTYLRETIGSLASRITRIGKAACVGKREPFRWMYAIVR